jgi:hypothetical protein
MVNTPSLLAKHRDSVQASTHAIYIHFLCGDRALLEMKTPWQFLAVSVMACVLSSCMAQTPDVQFVRQKIPIEIQSGRPVAVKIGSLSGNGWNEVGIRCSADVWKTLMDGKGNVTVRLTYSSKEGTKIINVSPGGHKLWPVDSFYYLFSIGGEYRADAMVEITFPNAPAGVTHAEIIVFKTPADTGL